MSPRKRAAKADPTQVEALRHSDRRANIPTNELRGMLADDERAPKAMLYPRTPASTRSSSGGERTSRTPPTSRCRSSPSTSRRRSSRG